MIGDRALGIRRRSGVLRRARLLAGITSLLLCFPLRGESCGPDLPDAVFVYTAHPDLEGDSYLAGRPGVLHPESGQSYLYVAYRWLSGLPLEGDAGRAALGMPGAPSAVTDTNWTEEWRKRRARALETQESSWFSTERSLETRDGTIFFLNCNVDAVRTAVRTLEDRIRREGGVTPAVRDWIEAQDRIFRICGGDSAEPPAAPSRGSPTWLFQDRAYQVAAAHFYAARFDEAIADFEGIARDRRSPWSRLAPYLVARSLTRKATLTTGFRQVDEPVLREAENRVERILSDPRARDLHPAARRLQDFISFRLHRVARLGELSRTLLAPRPGSGLGPAVLDFTRMLDYFRPEQAESLARIAPEYELADWILSFQAGRFPHAISRWQETKDRRWLLCALASLPADAPEAPALLRAAALVPRGHPGFATIAFHRARLLMARGEADPARALLDSWLAGPENEWPGSTRNLFLAERLRLARNLDELMRFGPRIPVAYSSLFETGEPSSGIHANAQLLDDDGAWILDRNLPVDLLWRAARSGELGAELRDRLTLATWVRSVLLERNDVALEAAPVLGSRHRELHAWMEAVRSSRSTDERRFAAVWMMLHVPGSSPEIRSGVGRLTPLAERDPFRANWWCPVGPAGEPFHRQNTLEWTLYPKGWEEKVLSVVLTPAERTAARREREALRRIGAGATYLARQVVTWARRHPGDPRVPEALHLSVRAGRFSCHDGSTATWARQAFQLLHSRYAKTEWARKTRYWYP